MACVPRRGISGTRGRQSRPGLDALLKGVARREFDIVAAPSASEPASAVLCCAGRSSGKWRSSSCEADREGRTMFTSIRKYNVRRGSAEEIARRVREGFVPLIRQMRGFKGYYLLDGGPDVLICAITSTSHRLRLRHPQQYRLRRRPGRIWCSSIGTRQL